MKNESLLSSTQTFASAPILNRLIQSKVIWSLSLLIVYTLSKAKYLKFSTPAIFPYQTFK